MFISKDVLSAGFSWRSCLVTLDMPSGCGFALTVVMMNPINEGDNLK